MRGDRPVSSISPSCVLMFTPHARGSTSDTDIAIGILSVYPACAGIDLYGDVLVWKQASLPRMRGDRPSSYFLTYGLKEFTPHARGSTEKGSKRRRSRRVYPACAGIDHRQKPVKNSRGSLPRMRGDRPVAFCNMSHFIQFTPHARGSTVLLNNGMSRQEVYPACAGIDP